jgi:hypothetical protein
MGVGSLQVSLSFLVATRKETMPSQVLQQLKSFYFIFLVQKSFKNNIHTKTTVSETQLLSINFTM